MLTEEEKITINNYNRFAREWVHAHGDPNQCLNEFEHFRNFLPEGDVLEIGTSGGRDAKRFIKAGYHYTGIEVTPKLFDEACINIPEAKLLLLDDIYHLNFLHQKFDGLWCAATLIHLPKSRVSEALQSIKSILKPDAVGFICLKEGIGDMVAIEDQYGLRYFSYYQQSEFHKILVQNEFSLLETPSKLPVSQKTTWLNYFIKYELN